MGRYPFLSCHALVESLPSVGILSFCVSGFQLPRIALDTGREGGKKKTTVFRMGEEKRQAKIAECRRERDLLRSTRREADDHTD